jgi:glycosyltransferase involved in cell wall biosynthesis
VRFAGQLTTREAVRAELDQADLFVLASLTEGLPRAMIEAMARSLPCIGTAVGGIPELLPLDAMVAPGNTADLAAIISAVVTDPARMASMSARNLAKAREYHEDIIRGRRTAFYKHLKEGTMQWLEGGAADPLLRPARHT